MKHLFSFTILFIGILLASSCKKTQESTDWTPVLKGTAWAGEFNYVTGSATDLQPCSLVLNSDGSFNWYEVINPQKGTWKVEGNQLALTFGTNIFTADIAAGRLTHFSSATNLSVQVKDLSATVLPTEESLKSTKGLKWTGSYLAGTTMSIDFDLNKKMLFRKTGEASVACTYTIEGAGVRFSRSSAGGTLYSYGVIKDSTSMNGRDLNINTAQLYGWKAQQQ